MDEVDGCSSSDRGGIAALIKIIKITRMPIVCISNDHSSRKI
jgi:replication factor C subunit 1